MFRKGLLALVAGLLLIPASSFAQGGAPAGGAYIQNLGSGQLNWQSMRMRVTGTGAANPDMANKAAARPAAIRAAKLDAFRNALEAIQGVYVTSETTVKDFVTQSDIIHTRIEGLIKGFSPVETKYLSDGTVEVILEIAITGDIAAALLPPEQFAQQAGAPAPPADGGAAPAGPIYTGLVVDARGLGARPAMSPKILDERGAEVYGSAMVSRDFALDIGVVGYGKDVDGAKANDRVAANPLVIKAVKLDGAKGADIIIPQAQADAIRAAAENLSFLSKCRVMVIL